MDILSSILNEIGPSDADESDNPFSQAQSSAKWVCSNTLIFIFVACENNGIGGSLSI